MKKFLKFLLQDDVTKVAVKSPNFLPPTPKPSKIFVSIFLPFRQNIVIRLFCGVPSGTYYFYFFVLGAPQKYKEYSNFCIFESSISNKFSLKYNTRHYNSRINYFYGAVPIYEEKNALNIHFPVSIFTLLYWE